MLAKDAFSRRGEVRFLDVREPHEFEAGHVPDSLHIPLMSLQERAGELDQDAFWVVTCQIGQRSDMAARFLRMQGFEAHNLEGGLEAWLRQGLPLAAGRDEHGRIVDGTGQVLDWLNPDPGH